jgi:WD40 repeat protein
MGGVRSALSSLLFCVTSFSLAFAGDSPVEKKLETAKLDAFGDPLPPGAYARFGTIRFRHDAKAVAFLSENTIVSVGSSIRFWDALNGRLVREHRSKQIGDTIHAAISANGKYALTRDRFNRQFVWDLNSGKLLRQIGSNDSIADFFREHETTSFSANGSHFVVREFDRRFRAGSAIEPVVVWSSDPAGEPLRLKTGNDNVRAFDLSPDGSHVATVLGTWPHAPKAVLAVWDVGTGGKIESQDLNLNECRQVRFAPDGNSLVFVGDTTIACRSIAGKELWRRATHCDELAIACFSGDRVVLFAPDRLKDGLQCRIVDLNNGEIVWQWSVPGVSAVDKPFAAASPDRQKIAIVCARRIRVLNLTDGKELVSPPGHSDGIENVCVTPDGHFAVSTDRFDREPIQWDATTGRVIRRFHGHSSPCAATECSADGRLLVSVSINESVRIWDLSSGRPMFELADIGDRIGWAGFLAEDGKLAVISCKDSTIIVYDYANRRKLSECTIRGLVYPWIVYCQSDGRLLAIAFGGETNGALGGTNNGFDIWDVRANRAFRHCDGYAGWSFRCAVSPDFRRLASYGDDGKIRIWEVSTGWQCWSLNAEKRDSEFEWLPALDFSRDGLTIATANQREQRIDLWNIPTRDCFGHLDGHRDLVSLVKFTPDGRRLLTGSNDTTMLGWDLSRPEWRSRTLARKLTEADLMRHWDRLRNGTAELAYQSKWALAGDPEKTVALIRERLKPEPALPADRIRRWMADLDSADYSIRERAQGELSKHFDQAETELRAALKAKPSAEARTRITRIIESTEFAVPDPDHLRELRANEILEQIATPEARDLLRSIAASPGSTRTSRDAAASLKRLENRMK